MAIAEFLLLCLLFSILVIILYVKLYL